MLKKLAVLFGGLVLATGGLMLVEVAENPSATGTGSYLAAARQAEGSLLANICDCGARGSLQNVYFWGPSTEYCTGRRNWGFYDEVCVNPVTRICSCQGGGVIGSGTTLWGPQGRACGGFRHWGTYSTNCFERGSREICACQGGGGLEGTTLWGPKGTHCTGRDNWGTYNANCKY